MQEKIEQVLSKILQEKIEITGCGRTDAGVHAKNYVAHFDAANVLPKSLLVGANSLLPPDIALQKIEQVAADAHARFDARERQYEYLLVFEKDPFRQHTAWHFPQGKKLDFQKMQQLAEVIRQQRDFFVFCKTDSGLDSFDCEIRRAEWLREGDTGLVFHISANRFLRGMVRLIVGASVQIGLGKISLEDVQTAFAERQFLKKSLSVPPEGLVLSNVIY